MPLNWVLDEDKWEEAKKIAGEEGKGDNYAYVTGIYKRMKGRIKKGFILNEDGTVVQFFTIPEVISGGDELEKSFFGHHGQGGGRRGGSSPRGVNEINDVRLADESRGVRRVPRDQIDQEKKRLTEKIMGALCCQW